jgi:hypothetical protein
MLKGEVVNQFTANQLGFMASSVSSATTVRVAMPDLSCCLDVNARATSPCPRASVAQRIHVFITED